MGWLRVNPLYRTALDRQGLITAAAFLRLPGVIVCGHPHRHVLKVEVGKLLAFLKKEHRVSWRERLANAWAGFGFVSTSTREALLLERIGRTGIPCPVVLAHGANAAHAFLLVGDQPGMTDVRHYLQ